MVEFYDSTSSPSVTATQVRTGDDDDTLDEKVVKAEYYKAAYVHPVFLVEIRFSEDESGILRANTSAFDLLFNNGISEDTYYGLGKVTSVGAVEEGVELQIYDVEMTLMGVPSYSLPDVLNTNYRNKLVRIWLGLFNTVYASAAKYSILNATQVFKGYTDVLVVKQGSDYSTINLTVKNAMIQWERPSGEKYTHAAQQTRYPGDNGLIHIAEMVEKSIKWQPQSVKK